MICLAKFFRGFASVNKLGLPYSLLPDNGTSRSVHHDDHWSVSGSVHRFGAGKKRRFFQFPATMTGQAD
jgi:hypothetical protein